MIGWDNAGASLVDTKRYGIEQSMQKQQKQHMKYMLDYELEEGEHLLWSGQPDPMHMAKQSSAILFVAIPWTALMFLWLVSSVSSLFDLAMQTSGAFLYVFIIPVGFLLLLLLSGIFLLDSPRRAYRRGRRTIYAITSRRVLIIVASNKRSVKSCVYPGNIERIERSGEKGDLIFGPQKDYRFIGISNVRMVEYLLMKSRFES